MEAKDMNEMEPRIIEAAKRVFVRKGYEAATMSDVAAEGYWQDGLTLLL